LGEYGSVENIIRANCELYDFLENQPNAKVFVHQNDPDLYPAAQKIQQLRAYGQGTDCEAKVLNRPFIKAEICIGEAHGQVQTRLFGRFWADTLAAVACIADSLGASLTQILAGLEAYTPQALRSQQIVWKNTPVLLDCYNANPSSMQVFVEEIQTLEVPKLLILGEMLELGEFSDAEHSQMLGLLRPDLYEKLILVGKAWQFLQTSPIAQSQPNRLLFVPSYEAASVYLQTFPLENLHIYVKGSRGNKLEKIFS
jgi:UDP-N-acetylmuramoyl-tripeptide--D-alanyl-D-alanine ligase